MVGGAGNAPVVTSDSYLRHRFYRPAAGTPPKIGSGGGSCVRTFALARRHSAVKYSRKESKRAGSNHAPGPCHFCKEHTSCYLAIPTHGFTVVLWVFWGTPPAKPLDCKIRPNSSGALSSDQWADPTGGEPRLSRAFLCFVPGDII